MLYLEVLFRTLVNLLVLGIIFYNFVPGIIASAQYFEGETLNDIQLKMIHILMSIFDDKLEPYYIL